MDLRSIFPLRRSSASAARTLALQIAAVTFLVSGCGGGGTAGPSSGGTGTAAASSFSAGTITGFGSVIVNGVRFDDSAATVSDDDGNASTKTALKLGMGVEVHGGAISDDGTGPRAAATDIHFGSELVGPVTAVDATAKSLVILGQTVLVLDTTVIDERLVGGFGAITVGTLLEVHGTLDAATGVYTATRLEPTQALARFKIRGIVANLDTTRMTFNIGTALVSFAGITPVPAALANGVLVKVRVQPAQVAGAWVATRLVVPGARVGDVDEAEIKGAITAFTSSASFSVNGIPVDASNATFTSGTAGVVLGAQVEVNGTSSNGVIIAKRVSVVTPEERRAEGFELHGAIDTIDTVAKTFVLRGVTVSYAAAGIEYRNGSEGQLAVGAKVEVRGTLSADGTMLQASRIAFGD
ncbi:MAG: DUF5666 domain-containing protein [Caldimonas sp.]